MQKLTKVKSGGKAYKTLQSQLKNIDRVIAGKDPISTTKPEKPTVTVKKVPKGAVADPNVKYFIDKDEMIIEDYNSNLINEILEKNTYKPSKK